MDNRKKSKKLKLTKIPYSEARMLIVPQKPRTYAQAVKFSTVTTITHTNKKYYNNISLPPLKSIQPIVYARSEANYIFLFLQSIPAVNKLYTSTYAHLLPSTSSVGVKTSSDTSIVNNLNASVSSLPCEARLFPSISDKCAALSTEIQSSVHLPDTTTPSSYIQPSVLS
ncbi:hypothetical protein TNCV_3706281 [Trichonephila clavipes]|nr:hypothetical protein TNCV_3706281 [Trichonephila clavipes]